MEYRLQALPFCLALYHAMQIHQKHIKYPPSSLHSFPFALLSLHVFVLLFLFMYMFVFLIYNIYIYIYICILSLIKLILEPDKGQVNEELFSLL